MNNSRRALFSGEQRAAVVEAVRNGCSYVEAAGRIGASPPSANRWCMGAGVRSIWTRGRPQVWEDVFPELDPRTVVVEKLAGVTYLVHPKWFWLLIADKELSDDSYNFEGLRRRMLFRLGSVVPVDSAGCLWSELFLPEIASHLELMERKRRDVDDELSGDCSHLFRVVDVEPLEDVVK